MTDQSYAKNL
jgi:hypothetical protein